MEALYKYGAFIQVTKKGVPWTPLVVNCNSYNGRLIFRNSANWPGRYLIKFPWQISIEIKI